MRLPVRLLALLGLLLVGRLAWATTPPTAGRPLAEVLNADGTLKPGLAGSFDPKGYELVDVAGSRQPTFRPVGAKRTQGAGDEKWRDGFGLSGANGVVYAVVRRGSDIYIGGDFTAVGTVAAIRVARWNGTVWSALGTGLNQLVRTLAVDGSGNVYAGGDFTQAGGIAASYAARWNGTAWSALGTGLNDVVQALVVDGSGNVYAGGSFTQAGGITANRIARWNGTAWSALGTGTLSPIRALAVDGNGNVYAGGNFTSISGTVASRIARWNGTAWSALGAGLGGEVVSLAVDGSGNVYAGGNFTQAAGMAANRIARWNGTAWSALGTGLSDTVQALAVDGSGNVYAGGSFTEAGGLVAFCVARWNGMAWSPLGTGTNNGVRALAVDGSNVYTGGDFTKAGGIPASYVACWNGTAWSTLGTGIGGGILALTVDGSGNVYAGGVFTTATGTTVNYVAKWNGTTWSALGTGMDNKVLALAVDSNGTLYAGGSFGYAGGTFAGSIAKWNGTNWSALGTGINGDVMALAVDGNGMLYAGGNFTDAGGIAANGIARWNGTAWSALGIGMRSTSTVQALAIDTNGILYAGGLFSQAGGVTVNHVAKWNGTAWSALGTGLSNGGVYALVVDNSGTLYAGGSFTTAGGTTVNCIARWNGTIWRTLGSGMNGAVLALALDGSGVLYAGGEFTTAGGGAVNYITKWNGTTWSSLGTGLNNTAYAVQAKGNTGVYAGGGFTTVGDGSKVSAYFGLYSTATAPTISAQTFTLPENSPNGTAVGTVQATGSGLTYSITAGNTGGAFAINSSTGALTVNNVSALDYETTPTFALTVQVTDGTTPATATVTVNLSDVDEVRPTVSITSPVGATGSSTSTAPIPFTVTFSENVTGFVTGDVTVTGGSIVPGSLTVLSGSTYTIQVMPAGNGAVTVSVPANVAQDAASNFNTAATPLSLTYSQPPVTAAPVVTAPAHVTLTNDNTPTYAGTAPAGSTVTVFVDGTAIGTTTAPGGSWTLTQPTALADATHTVNATAQTSGAALSATSNTNGFTVDATAPTVTLSSGPASGSTTTTSPLSFTATFSENVTGFVAGDLTVSNGTVTSGSTGSGSTYTFQVTPTTPGTATTVQVAASSVQDAAGNGNAASNTYSLTYTVTSVAWNGSTSTDWFTASNWTPNLVPTASLDATIPTAPSGNRFPVITANAATAMARNVSIAPGAALRMSANLLAIAGNMTNNGSFTGFTGSGSTATGGTMVLGGTVLSSLLGSGSTRFWDLAVGSSQAQLSTSAGASVRRLLTLSGNFVTQGNAFTLVSDADGTAMVYNQGGVISGNVTVQRYISPATNAGPGYRHYASPVGQATVGSLGTAGFTPVVNAQYNTSATPGRVTPFPTVYAYNQNRLNTTTSNLDAFSKGWMSPASPTDALTVGQGYSVNIAGGQTFSVTGGQNNGDVSQTLARGIALGNPDQAGWHLVGNPYPSPLNYARVDPADRVNIDPAIYIYASNGPYAGSYSSYVNGVGGNPILAQGQGFFARVSAGQTSGTLTFRNNQRVTTYANPTYQRGTTRPLVQLDLQGANQADPLYVYFEQGATAGTDREYDAVKLPNTTGLNLAAVAGTDELAISGLPTLGAASVTVPLQVRVPATGTYTLHAASIMNLPAGMVAYLRDRQTGALQDLSLQPDYSFQLNAAYTGVRFELLFSPQAALAVAPASLSAQVAVFPNPAHAAVVVELPAALSRTAATATLLDALGRPVRTFTLAVGTATHTLPVADVAAGIYSLRVSTAQGLVTKKLVIN